MCGADKPPDEFYKHRKTRNRLQPWCKQCTSDYNHETYRTFNPTQKRARSWRRRPTP
jgi:hypothetical protein